MQNIKLLDCTLRDGGYINDWKWGYHRGKDIIESLVKSNTDIVEVGFLRNVDSYDENISVCNRIEELNRLLPDNMQNTMFSAMAMRSNYDIKKLSEYNGTGIEMIRITAHDYDIAEGMDFAKEVKNKGYKLSINPINIMGYGDDQILWIIDQVNKIMPYQFSIVDTFGSMKRGDLDRIVSIVDHNLDKSIRVGLHLHENTALSFSLAQSFLSKNLSRDVTIDASLLGMGRVPGNLPIELIADYLNEYYSKNYDIDYMMDSIQDYITPYKEKTPWGYTPAYFLSARYNLHRNYAEFYLKKGDLTNRDINHILARIDKSKKTAFDSIYAQKLYDEYHNNHINDESDREKLKIKLENENILILAPGKTIVTEKKQIDQFINQYKPIIISLNFIPIEFDVQYAFFSNNKRTEKIKRHSCNIIVTSNVDLQKYDYIIDYNGISGAFTQGCNSLILLLRLLKQMEISHIYIAGADGYNDENNYYDSSLVSITKHDRIFNQEVGLALKELDMDLEFITLSEYQKYI